MLIYYRINMNMVILDRMDSQAEQNADGQGTDQNESQNSERNSIASGNDMETQSNKEEKKLGKYR